MRSLALNIATILCLLGVVASIFNGILELAHSHFIEGSLYLFIIPPISLALAVTFDYISEQIRRDIIEGRIRPKTDPIDTPWENDPDHV